MIYLGFVVARVALLGAAIWFARSRNPGVHAVAILFLLADLFSLWLAYSLVFDPRVYWLGGPILIWVLGGPLILAAVLFEAAAVAPVIVLASLICAGAVGFLVWRFLWRIGRRRLWTVVAAFAGIVSAVVVLEIEIEATMRADAGRIPNSCGLLRPSVIDMMINGGGSYARERHGELRDGATNYAWSFRNGGWIPQYACSASNSVGCSCRD